MKRINTLVKKFSVLALCLLTLLLLCSCNAAQTETDNDSSSIPTPSSSSTPATTETVLPLPDGKMEFSFLSGAGAWRTTLTLNSDGTFNGFYLDSEMGEAADEYPEGSAYTCTFNGKFDNIQKINEFSYKMSLAALETEDEVGKEWIEDSIRYIASDAYGIAEGSEFIFYLPETPINDLPEEFLSWWPFRYDEESKKETLSCYAIRNTATDAGFFSE